MTILNKIYEDTTIEDIQNEIINGEYEDMADLLDQNSMAFGFTDEEISILEDVFADYWKAEEADYDSMKAMYDSWAEDTAVMRRHGMVA